MKAKDLRRLRQDVKQLVREIPGVETLGIGREGANPVVVIYLRKGEVDEAELRILVKKSPIGVIFEYTNDAIGHGVVQ